MKRFVTHVLCCLVLVVVLPLNIRAADAAAKGREANVLSRLQGTWVGGVQAPGGREKSGKAVVAELSEVTIRDGKITAKDGKGSSLGLGTFTVNVNSKPMILDAVAVEGKMKGSSFPGIFRFDGEKLEWCSASPNKTRPTAFFSKAQVQSHMILKRK